MVESIEQVFKCTVARKIYSAEGFRVYAVEVDRDKYPKIKQTKYGTVSICGDIHELGIGVKYEAYATEENGKNGYSYRIRNIKREKPTTSNDMELFLLEILTHRQAQSLYAAYPDIVVRVIEDRIDDIDLSKTYGIKEYTFNRIKEKIVENYCLVELVDEFKGLLSLSMLKKIYLKYASIQMVRKKMKADPYKCLCDISGIGFKTADSLLLEVDRVSKENIMTGKPPIIEFEYCLMDSHQRCLACVMYLLQENESNGHTKMNIIELKDQCEKLVPACAKHFPSVVKDENIFYDKITKDASLRSTYEIELSIAQSILEALKIKKEWDCNIEAYRTCDNGVQLVDQQVNAIENLRKYNVSILNGSAGTGKSQTTSAMIKMLDDLGKSYKLLSPTGRAAKILKNYTNRPTSTVHRGLGFYPPNDWCYNKENKLDVDVIIIDEASMCDIFMFRRVIDAIDFSQTKLVLVGDNAQLPSVSCGNLLHDFIESHIIPVSTLSIVFRYGEGGLMKVATDVRQMKKFLDGNVGSHIALGDNKDYMFIQSSSEKTVKNVLSLYKKLMSQGYCTDDMVILSAQNKGELGTVVINNHVQKIANPNALQTTSEKIRIGETTYYVGDIVIQTKNNYKAKLDAITEVSNEWETGNQEEPQTFIANGETGKILQIDSQNVIIDFDGNRVKYSRDEMSEVNLGYCISCHKSQGGSFKIVIFISPSSHTFMLNSNLMYVGLTRTTQRCFHVGDIGTINKAVKKKENLKRNTFMQGFLCGKIASWTQYQY